MGPVRASPTPGAEPLPGSSIQESGFATPIQSVVIIDQENHSFDNVLGKFCDLATRGWIQRDPCEGATTGVLPDGTIVPLQRAADLVPKVDHTVEAQQTAIAGGQMNGFGLIPNCTINVTPPPRCYSQFTTRDQIPNVWDLAKAFALSDHTFELRATPSWAGHMVLASATVDGFQGDNPTPGVGARRAPGWGCDSYKDAQWGPQKVSVPSCVPDSDGNGPYRSSPVQYVPTIFKELDDAQRSWTIYGGQGTEGKDGYAWTICPTFFECLNTQSSHLVPAEQVLLDAQSGALPNFSIVTPTTRNSQHNQHFMSVGDSWIGRLIGHIMNGRQWSSTAIFLTWDDCGCFYDHVNPLGLNPDWGIRVPMIIISPYVRSGYTDSSPATFASLLAFTEHLFGLQPLTQDDASAYDYHDSFNFHQSPLRPIPVTRTKVPAWKVAWMRTHPDTNEDGT